MFTFFGQRRRRIKDHNETLRNSFFNSDARPSDQAKKAIAYCKYCIFDYEDLFEYNHARWFFWQAVVLVGGVVATLAGIMTIPPEWVSWLPHPEMFAWVRGVPAGFVTIASGLLSSFTYKEDAVRHEMTANALWNELAKFQSHTTPYDKSEETDVSLFVNNVCSLVDREVKDWVALATSKRNHDGTTSSSPKNAVA